MRKKLTPEENIEKVNELFTIINSLPESERELVETLNNLSGLRFRYDMLFRQARQSIKNLYLNNDVVKLHIIRTQLEIFANDFNEKSISFYNPSEIIKKNNLKNQFEIWKDFTRSIIEELIRLLDTFFYDRVRDFDRASTALFCHILRELKLFGITSFTENIKLAEIVGKRFGIRITERTKKLIGQTEIFDIQTINRMKDHIYPLIDDDTRLLVEKKVEEIIIEYKIKD